MMCLESPKLTEEQQRVYKNTIFEDGDQFVGKPSV